MAKLRVHNIAVSLDGYAAGPDQSVDHPMGIGGTSMHTWAFAVREGAGDAVDAGFLARGEDGIGATIMGRNMFGPVRGAWAGSQWRGWWGDEPPYHHPVFVLTHHEHDPIEMAGGTTFHFVVDGIESALEQAVEAAAGADIRLGGGASTIQQYLRAGLVDELHIAIVPVLLGSGERLFVDVGTLDGYEHRAVASSPGAAHFVLTRR